MFAKISNQMLFLLFVLQTLNHIEWGRGFVLEGSPTSYAQFPKWCVGINGTFEFEFKTEETNGLLMYTDDGGTFDFFEVKLVEGALRLRYNLGSGASFLTVGKNLNDNKWHKVEIVRQLNETKLKVDQESVSTVVRGVEMKFGNYTTNSYVYIGGVPGWYATKLQLLALPSVYFEPRFRGSVRNLLFADSDGSSRRQEMIESKGVRTNKKDMCEYQDPCQHGGICISTDHGAICDCRFIDFEGSFCEKGNRTIRRRSSVDQSPSEATFRGHDYLSYDRKKVGGEPIVSTSDAILLHFKTRQPNGLLFFTGEGEDYLNLALKDGGVILTITLGSRTLEKHIKPSKTRFDDNQWHKVTVHRSIREISLGTTSFCRMVIAVDSVHSDRGTIVGAFSVLSSSVIYVAGSDNTPQLPGSRTHTNFIGCLRKVEFSADSLNLNLIDLARTSNKFINVHGNVQFMCQEVEAADPITFTTKESYLVLPSWESSRTGHISFKIRTNEPNGLLMYNSGAAMTGGDFFAFELMEGHIFLLLNLGSGAIKIKATNRRVDDGQWHAVALHRRGKHGHVNVDESSAEFITPGESNQLDLAGSLFVGGVGTSLDAIAIPSDLWSGSLAYGYVGCMRDLVLNGKAIDIAAYAKKQDSGSIRPACHPMPVQCDSQPCMNGGICSEGWNRFICDCSMTSFIGPTCGKDATTLSFDGNQYMKITMPEESRTQAEDINLRFHTNRPNGLLLATTTDRTSDRLELAMDGGRIRLAINLGDGEEVKYAGQGLNDNQWHTLRIMRRGSIIELRVDEEPPIIAELPGKHTTLDFSQMHIGAIVKGTSTSTPGTQETPKFNGHIQQLVFNGNYFIDMARSSPSSNVELTAVFGPSTKCKSNACSNRGVCVQQWNSYTCDCDMTSFTGPTCSDESIAYRFGSKHGLMTFNYPPDRRPDTKGDLLALAFITTKDSGVLVRIDSGSSSDYLELSIVEGGVFMVYNMGSTDHSMEELNVKVNDDHYHVVRVTRSGANSTIQVDDYNVLTKQPPGRQLMEFNSQSRIQIGGIKSILKDSIERPFEGIITGLFFNGLRILDLAAEKDPRTTVEGDVELLMSIPHMKRPPAPSGPASWRGDFPLSNMQQTTAISGTNSEDLISSGSGCGAVDDEDCGVSPVDHGSGDDLITPVYIPPTPKPQKTTPRPPTSPYTPPSRPNASVKPKPCDDEDCNEGSGSEEPIGVMSLPGILTTSMYHPTSPMQPPSTPSTVPIAVISKVPDEMYPRGGPGYGPEPSESTPRETIDGPGRPFEKPIIPTSGDGYGSEHSQPPSPPKQNPGSSWHPTQGSSSPGGGTTGDGVALVIGIVAGILSVVVLVILLVCKFCVQSEGSYKVDESKNYQFAGRGSPSLGDGIHGPGYGMGAGGGGGGGGMGLGLGPMGMGMGGGADGRGIYGTGSLGFINGQQPQMNGNVKMGEKACKLPKKKDLKDIKEWYV